MAGAGTVAVIGAGIAGATVANRLSAAGLDVRVFDKGRGVGGRMATRRTEAGLRFDHGAQFFRPRGEAFRAQCAAWAVRGVAAPWGEADRFVGVPGMPAPVADLLGGIAVVTETTITDIARTDAGWMLTDAGDARFGPFAALALCLPAPQVAALLAASRLTLPGPEQATYRPCWSLMLALDGDDPFTEPRLECDDGPIALIARQASKPGREGGGFVAHASPSWSRAHLEEAHDAVRPALVAEVEAVLGHTLRPVHAAVHRWRYAMVETALGQSCLYDPSLRLGAAGDWCLGPRVEAAFDSGRALAERIAADLAGAR